VNRLSTLGALAVIVLATGCGTEPGVRAVPPAQNVLTGRTFLSSAVTENGAARQLAPGTQISLWFAEDGRLVANAGCNTLQGPVDTAGGHLSAPDLSMTEMGCDAARHAQDEWLAKLLATKPSWQLQGDSLTVESGTTTITLRDKKVAVPDLSLEGRRWTLDTIVTGEVASHGASYAKAYLEFADGRVTGSAGCNAVRGPATISGDTIAFGPIARTRKACATDVNAIERAVLAVLDAGTTTYRIDAGSLTLKNTAGTLVFTAA
jgi:heat shock protein HslJ